MVASKLIKMEEGILLEEKDLSFNKNRKSVKIFITVSWIRNRYITECDCMQGIKHNDEWVPVKPPPNFKKTTWAAQSRRPLGHFLMDALLSRLHPIPGNSSSFYCPSLVSCTVLPHLYAVTCFWTLYKWYHTIIFFSSFSPLTICFWASPMSMQVHFHRCKNVPRLFIHSPGTESFPLKQIYFIFKILQNANNEYNWSSLCLFKHRLNWWFCIISVWFSITWVI